jgi:DNA-binding PadR family transcriptional regulator
MATEKNEGLPRRFLPAFLLLSLERDGTSYGYELCETVKALGLSVDLAAVYRGLRTMQQRDLVTSQWVPSLSGPDRRLYSLTGSGQLAAQDAARDLATVRDGLVAALEYFQVLDGTQQ